MKKFKDLPGHSRVWIYQSNRVLSNDEISTIESRGRSFIENWSAHGADLNGALEVIYKQFIVLALDEQVASATGCSIDKSVHFFQQLGNDFNVDLFNRLLIAYRVDDSIELLPMSDFQDQLANGKFTENTQVFNNLVTTLDEFRNQWEVAVKDSWHKQLLPTNV
ncbi:MAG: ABC transporter ATPase [Crocinitomicaceae bacterium]|nr:ABC transporter ATPase [Crocinitomicaceae bacterium]|tara:strand:- start:251 stop:742 length:492 start_codon:yes stop_codon:yes gene_type:complete